MRLLTVGSLPPEWGGPVRGGVATFHAALLTAILDRKADVSVVGILPPAPLDREIPFPVWVRPEEVGRAGFYEEMLDRLRPDVVLMNHIAHTIGVTHARLGSPVPALGVVQSWHSVTFKSGEERNRAVQVNEEALTGLAALVTPSHHCLDEGKQLGFRYPRVAEAIHNPVPPLYMRDDVDVRGQGRRGVVYLGSLIPRKEPRALVEAAAQLPDLAVSLVGEGELEGDLRRCIDSLGVGDRVRVAEPPSREGHLEWIRERLLSSKVMCLPSSSEGLPLAFVEALACGTPIVGFGPAVREIREEVGIDVGEPIDSSDPDEIAAALEAVLRVDWNREELRRAALSAFGLDRIADAYVEMLGQIATPSKSVPLEGAPPNPPSPTEA